MDKNEIAIVIPAYQPDDKLVSTVRDLAECGYTDILVVDDGSDESCADVFRRVEELPECTVLRHPVNRGKGAALKKAFLYVLQERRDKKCVVTADADGQHLVKDITAVADTCLEQEKVVLGTRDFSRANVPARSVFGNRITSGVFRLFFGMKIRDTQTGLRAFPTKYLASILRADGDRYEYETNMLFLMNRENIPFEQVDIETVYLDDNKSSHFHVIRDSIRIYALILKYLLSSLAGAAIDEIVFYIIKKFRLLAFLPIPLTFSAAIAARIVSSLVNYWMNAKHVFKGKLGVKTLLRYYLLAVAQIAASAVLVFALEHLLRIHAPGLSTLVKTIVDTILFFVSFRIQHKWVFREVSDK